MAVFWLVHQARGTNPEHISNVVLADTSFVLLCLVLILGPAARFFPRMRKLVPWGRELGIGMFVTASLHVVLLLDGYLEPLTLFSFENLRDAFFGPYGYIAADDLWTAANWVGLFALGYALILAATSNDSSQRLLGRGWKFTQRQTYTLGSRQRSPGSGRSRSWWCSPRRPGSSIRCVQREAHPRNEHLPRPAPLLQRLPRS
jgi:DMSO/TMAO reductase YedYZ heme-binding membrane subunit